MSTAKHICNEVRTLSESQPQEVLDFVVRLKAAGSDNKEARRKTALGTLAKYRGRFAPVKTQRDELHGESRR